MIIFYTFFLGLLLWIFFIYTNQFTSNYSTSCKENNQYLDNKKKKFPYDLIEDKKSIKKEIDEDFLYWFIGFIDAEGCFSIFIDKDNLSCRFKFVVNLHSDDLKVLEYMRNTLNIGNVNCYEDKNNATWVIYNLDELKYILTIFDLYHLQSKKYVDYKLFKTLLTKKLLLTENKVDTKEINSILLKEFNKYKPLFNKTNYILSKNELVKDRQFNINSNWIVGFVEGEGTFGVKGLRPYFQVGQNKISENVLIGIEEFFINNNKDRTIKFSKSQTDEVKVIMMMDMDNLWFVILPFFENHNMHTKKVQDFILWKKVLYICKSGLHLTSEGRELLVLITKVINERGKSVTKEEKINILLDIDMFYSKLLEMKPLIDKNSTIPYSKLMITYSNKNRNKNLRIYIYEVKGDKYVLLEGSPFKKYADANEALGLNRSGRSVFKNLDTDKLYNCKYKIVSKELKSIKIIKKNKE